LFMKVEFFKHSIDENDVARANEVLRSIFLTTGSRVEEFENTLAAYLGSQGLVGLTSCTAALHLCLLAWGVGPGDEVITTPMTFCATANAVLHVGAVPVFVDVEPDTGNIDAGLIESRITERTKAVIPVHLYGQMCDMKRIRRIADQRGLAVIEDAAHCLEGEREGVRPGRLGEAACFSFYATKNITSGEGGAVAANQTSKLERLKVLRLHGMDKSAADRYTKEYRHWDMKVLGWKYNMDNIQAALLLGQLERIETLWLRRDEIVKKYQAALASVPGIRLLKDVPDSKHARHLFTILVPPERRDGFLTALQRKGVGVAVNYRAVHLLEYYRERFGFRRGDFPVAEEIGDRTVSLPLYPKLEDSQVDYVIDCVLAEAKSF